MIAAKAPIGTPMTQLPPLGEPLSAARRNALAASTAQAGQLWLGLNRQTVEAHYNRQPFLIKHRLHEHPHFELGALQALCRRLGPGQAICRTGVIPVDAAFDSSLGRYNKGLSLDQALSDIEQHQAYIAVYNPERDPEYRPVIEALVGEIAVGIGSVDPGMNWFSTYLFISAQGSITPYHMDREMNFLLQIRGAKQVQLWDPDDDDVMSSVERDRLLAYVGERPGWRQALAEKAQRFELSPGLGVHHPFIAPHLVETGSALSISLAITFRTQASDLRSEAHRFNMRLRRLGLNPAPVGRDAIRDRAKALLHRSLLKAKAPLSLLHGMHQTSPS
jgi:hypothetical protein